MYCRLLLPSTLYMKKNLHLTLPGPYSSKKLICTSPFKMKSSDGWWSWPEKTTITKYKACFCRNKQENDIFNSNGLGPLTYESWSWEYNTVAWKQLRESDYQIINLWDGSPNVSFKLLLNLLSSSRTWISTVYLISHRSSTFFLFLLLSIIFLLVLCL